MKSKVEILGIYVFSIVLFLLGYFFEDLNSAILIFVICIIPLYFVNYLNTNLLFIAKGFKNKKITYLTLLSILPFLSLLVFFMNWKDFKILSLSSIISLLIINNIFHFRPNLLNKEDTLLQSNKEE